ncbi:hypothetical protein FRB91_006269 [Serendipita sp. 411]|nr:hypothetical protein FRB91_006269 [Serendipita sp. 411]
MAKTMEYTPLDEIAKIHDTLLASFISGKMQSIAVRKKQIAKVAYMIKENTNAIHDALFKDLHRSPAETTICDLSPVLHEAVHTYNHIDKWTKDIKPSTTAAYHAMNLRVKPSPKGVVLIIAPFNFPLILSLTPLISAIAAGCTVVLKFSEMLPSVSPLLQGLIEKYLDPQVVRVVQGAIPETSALLNLEWNHIFFTGSPRVGQIVATAAAKFTTPVTLELGGKCPIIVDPHRADYKLIARRILWGRATNSGQVCVSPDYVLIPRAHQKDLADALRQSYEEFWPSGTHESASFGRIVNPASAKRVSGYINESKGNILFGGVSEPDQCFVPLTVLTDVAKTDSTMQEEIFGPVLSIVPVDSLDEAIDFVNERPQPLALYVFTRDARYKEKVARNTRSGAIVFNDTMMHGTAPGLPFGGSGSSGYGQYHGKWGFDTFTHYRASLDNPSWTDRFVQFRYPPYTEWKVVAAKAVLSPVVLPFDKDGKKTYLKRLQQCVPVLILIAAVLYSRQKYQARLS